MICHFKFFMTEVPTLKKPLHSFAEQITSTIYTEPSGLLVWEVNLQAMYSFFGLKKILVSSLNTMSGILCGDIISERSKILNLQQINID